MYHSGHFLLECAQSTGSELYFNLLLSFFLFFPLTCTLPQMSCGCPLFGMSCLLKYIIMFTDKNIIPFKRKQTPKNTTLQGVAMMLLEGCDLRSFNTIVCKGVTNIRDEDSAMLNK